MHTAVSRKVVGKSARDNPERYCGWFSVHCFSKKFQRMAREAMQICLPVLKETNKSRFDSYSVRNKCIDHIPYYLSACRVHSFCDNLSRNSCMLITVVSALTPVQGIILRKHHKVSNVVLDDGIQSLTSFFSFPSFLARFLSPFFPALP